MYFKETTPTLSNYFPSYTGVVFIPILKKSYCTFLGHLILAAAL